MVNAEDIQREAMLAGNEVIEPVGKWGGVLAADVRSFFESAESPAGDSKYFLAVFNLNGGPNLRQGLLAVHSLVRGNSKYFADLLDSSCVSKLLDLLKAQDQTTRDKAASVLTGAMWRYPTDKLWDARVWDGVNAYINGGASEFGKLDVLANLMKYDAWRVSLWPKTQGSILANLKPITTVPVLYKALMCVWLAGYNDDIPIDTGVIEQINSVISTVKTEKIVRMSLMALQNLSSRPVMCESMAEADTVKLISALEYEKWRDEDLVELV